MAVDHDDPELKNPTKFIGRAYPKDVADSLARNHNWEIREDKGRGFRRVVGSPKPLSIINKDVIRLLLEQGYVVIAAGGGGIPVYIMQNKFYEGMDAVIDKDRAAAVLARDIGAQDLFMLTEVDKVCLNFGTPEQKELDHMSIAKAKKYLKQGHFPPGTMGPKIEAAISFLEFGGEEVLITSIDHAADALAGTTGTRIVND